MALEGSRSMGSHCYLVGYSFAGNQCSCSLLKNCFQKHCVASGCIRTASLAWTFRDKLFASYLLTTSFLPSYLTLGSLNYQESYLPLFFVPQAPQVGWGCQQEPLLNNKVFI